MDKPIKQHRAPEPMSCEHHHGVLFCWKIKAGLKNGIAPARMKKYADWFFENHIDQHFKIEEEKLFSILESHNPKVKQAISEHRRLETLFRAKRDLRTVLELIANELSHHIRFEEKVLFKDIQRVANPEQLKLLEEIHQEVPDSGHWKDEFWLGIYT